MNISKANKIKYEKIQGGYMSTSSLANSIAKNYKEFEGHLSIREWVATSIEKTPSLKFGGGFKKCNVGGRVQLLFKRFTISFLPL